MAQQHINLGTPPAGVDGDTNRGAWTKAEANFTDLYSFFGGDSPQDILAEIEQNTADIATLKPEVATNTTNITTNTTNIGTNSTDIANLKTKTDTTNTNVATNTAKLAQINLGASAFKNRLINGNFDLWQRGSSFAFNQTGQGVTGAYTADRWVAEVGGCNLGITWNPFQPGGSVGGTNYPAMGMNFSTSAISDAAGHRAVMMQRIEGVRASHNQVMTASFSVYNPLSTPIKIGVEGRQAFGAGGSPSTTVSGLSMSAQSVPPGWTFVSFPMVYPSIAGKTIGTNGGDWYSLCIWFSAGTAPVGGAPPVGQQVIAGGLLSGVTLEPGTVATAFDMRPPEVELALCQRYYEKSYAINVAPGSAFTNALSGMQWGFSGIAGQQVSMSGVFKATKRTAPAFTVYDASGTAGRVSYLNSAAWAQGGVITGYNPDVMGWWGVFNNLAATITRLEFMWTADAEL